MKATILILKIVPLLILCISLNTCNVTTQPVIETVDTTGYSNARRMNGLAGFIIDSSTYIYTLESIKNLIRDSYLLGSRRYFYLPANESLTGKEKFSFFEKADSSVKTVEIYEYFVDSYVIEQLNLNFLNDTLVTIICKSSQFLEDAFNEKYGTGRPFTEEHSGTRWENARVRCSSYSSHYFTKSGLKKTSYSNFEIISKHRHEKYAKQIILNDQRRKKAEDLKLLETYKQL